MRTTILKIDGQNKEATLVAGGPGYKIYSITGEPGWAIVMGKKIIQTEDKIVTKYVTRKYQPIDQQQNILNDFDKFIRNIKKGITAKVIQKLSKKYIS